MNLKRKTLILIMATIAIIAGQQTKADFVFGEPENLGQPINTPMVEDLWGLSWDSLSLCFGRPQTNGSAIEVLVAQRVTKYDPWGTPVSLGSRSVNTGAEGTALVEATIEAMGGVIAQHGTADNLEQYLATDTLSGYGFFDLFVVKRDTIEDQWSLPSNLGPNINTSDYETHGPILPDGLTLYFSSNGLGGYGRSDIFVTTRATRSDPWSEPTNLGSAVNSPGWDLNATLSSDGLSLFFGSDRPGGSGKFDVWMTRRSSLSDPWGQAVNLGPTVNTSVEEDVPHISPDGSILYFMSNRPGGYGDYDIWQVPIEPIVDLNGDGIVDAADMCIVLDNWGTDDSLCDIGPMPWGDGIVDVQDLIVLAEHLFEEIPPS